MPYVLWGTWGCHQPVTAPSNLSSVARTKSPARDTHWGGPMTRGPKKKLRVGLEKLMWGLDCLKVQLLFLCGTDPECGIQSLPSSLDTSDLAFSLPQGTPGTLRSGPVHAMVVDLAPVAESSWCFDALDPASVAPMIMRGRPLCASPTRSMLSASHTYKFNLLHGCLFGKPVFMIW